MSTAEGVSVPEGEALRSKIQGLKWAHHIALGPYTTPGMWSKRHQDWVRDNLPQDLSGRTVLDIGAWDGYFSFLAEERHASRVVAIDSFLSPEHHKDTLAAFELAKGVRGSKVEYRVMDLFDAEELAESFDVILFLGVYYHLRDPIHALERLRSVLRPHGRLFMEGLVAAGSAPVLRFCEPGEIDPFTFSIATVRGVVQMAHAAGFREAKLLGLSESLWKAWLHATVPRSLRPRVAAFVRRRTGRGRGLPRAIFELGL
ncbi:MAG: DUF1698 domain-containing protein [Euryarchaeota archaeon]|nr:DUF1698 domain-containing protein [Euryarchaeota archaeon]MDE1836404.1 DUF1698 domain-containing protein [Euryarchaeota archaeon]MDE1879081.1 DUF1698 domain-containing protein [Euryarchaeota archaeon]MDE2044152.1 DUF1698 domain-containing protein [Thermoplasmata archaeon]